MQCSLSCTLQKTLGSVINRLLTGFFQKMKQIAYLTMVFLPASFAAVRQHFYSLRMKFLISKKYYQGIFGMNVGEINPGTKGTISQYIAVAVPLTIVSIWVIMAFQSKHIFPRGTSFAKRLGWPIFLIPFMMSWRRKPEEKRQQLEYPQGVDHDFKDHL